MFLVRVKKGCFVILLKEKKALEVAMRLTSVLTNPMCILEKKVDS